MMKKLAIYDPAMCCPTGVCGPSVNPELLRMATVINNLKINGIMVERYNLSGNPEAFIQNAKINELLNHQGIEILPVTMVDGVVVKMKGYLTNAELCKYLEIPEDVLKLSIKSKSNSCGCKGGCC